MLQDGSSQDLKGEPTVGSYRLLRPLGSGGMSSVFLAVHEVTGVEVAIKILPRALARNPILLQRFLREARSAEALEHPNIVAIYDRGQDQGRYYLVLEYVEGGDLHDWVRANGPMPERQAIASVRSVAEGLRYALGRGVIHRDIKPANLLIGTAGLVKVADLGLALQAESEDERVTREGTTVGTVDYMAPEQARDSRATTFRSDIYSLGCTFFFLLTGQPPFPGGDVAEKLTKHCTVAPPDPRQLRPELSPALAKLILRMLAKRPENRFENYEALLDALDTLDTKPSTEADRRTSGEANPVPFAEPDEALALDGFQPLELAPASEDLRADMLADLARSTDSVDFAPLERLAGTPIPRPLTRAGTPLREALTGEDHLRRDEELAWSARSSKMTESERTWLVRCVFLGLGLIALVIGGDQVLRRAGGPAPRVLVPAESPERSGEGGGSGVNLAPLPPSVLLTPGRRASAGLIGAGTLATSTPIATTWKEPADPAPNEPKVPARARGELLRFVPSWAVEGQGASKVGGGNSLTRPEVSMLRGVGSDPLATGATTGPQVVEFGDDGPFFVKDVTIAGRQTVYRGAPGYRPLFDVTPGRRALDTRERPILSLDGQEVTFEDMDFVVDFKDLPRGVPCLIEVNGSRLTFRHCTITLVNRGGVEASFIKTGTGAGTIGSRIVFEETFIRGACRTLLDLTMEPAEVVFLRSVALNGNGSALSANRRVRASFVDSFLATREAAIEVVGAGEAASGGPLRLRSLGTTFAKLTSPNSASLIHSSAQGGATREDVRSRLDWMGESNAFLGWKDWASTEEASRDRVVGLETLRRTWPGTDLASREREAGVTIPTSTDEVLPATLWRITAEEFPILFDVAAPSPEVLPKTVEGFPRPFVPGLTTSDGFPIPRPSLDRRTADERSRPRAGVVNDAIQPSVRPQDTLGARKATRPELEGTVDAGGVRTLTFRADDTEWGGDPGRLINAVVKPSDRLVRVRATGSGVKPWSRVVLPPGVSLDVIVEPQAGRPPLRWYAPAGTSGEALIEVDGGSISLAGVHLDGSAAVGLRSLVRVNGGHLVVKQSSLESRGGSTSEMAHLLTFSAGGTRPLEARPWAQGSWPLDVASDRPTMIVSDSALISNRSVVKADLGRGLLAFSHVVISAGSTAFALHPQAVARRRFEADLWLDHCTLASERSIVAMAPWPGQDPGPDRPWLISSHRTAYFASYVKPNRDAALLELEAGTLAHGVAFWQGMGDAIELPWGLASASPPGAGSGLPFSVTAWAALWGDKHVVETTGPKPNGTLPSSRLLTRLRAGEVSAADLAIDPHFPAGTPARDLGADLSRLGLGLGPVSRGIAPR